MRKTLLEFYRGNIIPSEKAFKRNTEFDAAIKIVSGNEQKLFDILREEEKALLEGYSKAQMDVNGITAEEYFVDGFKMGARFMLEILTDDSDGAFRSIIDD